MKTKTDEMKFIIQHHDTRVVAKSIINTIIDLKRCDLDSTDLVEKIINAIKDDAVETFIKSFSESVSVDEGMVDIN